MVGRGLGVGMAVLLLVSCGDDEGDGGRSAQASDAAARAGLPDDVQEVLGRAGGAAAETFHIEYDVTAADGSVQHVRVWQRPPDRRIDVVKPDGSEERTILRDGTTHQCSRTGEAWTCAPLADGTGTFSVGSFDPEAVDRTTKALADSRDDYTFEVEERTIAGADASCLVTRRIDAPIGVSDASLCVSPEGALLAVDRPTERLAATVYRTDVGDDAFELPNPAVESPQVPSD